MKKEDVEIRTTKILFAKNGNGYTTTRITLPVPWVKEMGFDDADRTATLKFDGKKIIINKEDFKMEGIIEKREIMLAKLRNEHKDLIKELETIVDSLEKQFMKENNGKTFDEYQDEVFDDGFINGWENESVLYHKVSSYKSLLLLVKMYEFTDYEITYPEGPYPCRVDKEDLNEYVDELNKFKKKFNELNERYKEL